MARVVYCRERPTGDLVEIDLLVEVEGERVPATFYRPAEVESPAPLVVIQHPATGSKEDYFVRDVAMQWARRGWICGGLDAPFHGSRDEYDPMRVLRDRELFGDLARQFAGEVTSVIDVLAEAYPVDLDRLGYVGYSMGSMLGIPAVATDGRFRAAAFCLIGEGGMLGSASAEDSPVRQLGGVSVRIVAKLADQFFPKEASQALHDALPGRKDLVFLPGGHFEIGPDVISAAGEWLAREL